jgi:hypothetical protein
MVDIKYRNFIFLDSWYTEGSSYHKKVSKLMVISWIILLPYSSYFCLLLTDFQVSVCPFWAKFTETNSFSQLSLLNRLRTSRTPGKKLGSRRWISKHLVRHTQMYRSKRMGMMRISVLHFFLHFYIFLIVVLFYFWSVVSLFYLFIHAAMIVAFLAWSILSCFVLGIQLSAASPTWISLRSA